MVQENNKNGSSDVNIEEVKELYEFMRQESLDELEISKKGFSIRMSRNSVRPMHYAPPEFHIPRTAALPVKPAAPAPLEGESIKAPIGGTFYRAPSPKSSQFVNEGDKVAPGATVCILEAMKVMNEIKTDKQCEIIKIVNENGAVVKAGDVLFIIKST
jgi:acetyl-CoA carboxylase biotin carboxyl carrier protein